MVNVSWSGGRAPPTSGHNCPKQDITHTIARCSSWVGELQCTPRRGAAQGRLGQVYQAKQVGARATLHGRTPDEGVTRSTRAGVPERDHVGSAVILER